MAATSGHLVSHRGSVAPPPFLTYCESSILANARPFLSSVVGRVPGWGCHELNHHDSRRRRRTELSLPYQVGKFRPKNQS